MAYDASSGRVVLFGGYGYTGFSTDTNTITYGYFNDTWTLQLGAANIGTANVCPAGATTPAPCSQTATLSFSVASGTTIGSIKVVTQGATGLDFAATSPDTSATLCTAQTYTSGTICTVDVTFKPTHPGPRYGAVELLDGSGNLLANNYVWGNGVGPLATFAKSTSGADLPSAQSTLGSGFRDPSGVAVDESGNVFVADRLNKEVKEIMAAGGYTTVNTLGSGFLGPQGLAVDGSGNVFVADYGYSAVKEIVAASGYTTVKTLGSGFGQPGGVAVDGSGNVFVADTQNNAVKEIVAAGGYTTIKTLGSGFLGAQGVAVDGSGNVFVADTLNSAVEEIVAASGYTTVNTLGGGFSSPYGVAVDGSGNVFVANTSNGTIKEIVAVNGSIPASPTIRTLGSGFSNPNGVAVDGSGNVFVADDGNITVKELDFADPPSLSFASATLGSQSSDSPLSVTVWNNGNADLTFPVLAVNNPSVASGFTLDGATTCPQLSTISAAGTLAAGTSCAYAVDFIPAASGLNSGSLALTDNNLNAASPGYATQSIGLSGTGSGEAPAITTNPLNQTVPAGSTATFTAAASGVPTPTVQWQVSVGGGAFSDIFGATSTTLSFSATAGQNGNQYQAVFTSTVSSVTTSAATLTVTSGPSITTNPISQTVTSGANVTFIAAATGNPAPTVQWQVSVGGGAFTNITGATSTTLSFTATSTLNGNRYQAVFTNTVGGATTSAATLTVTSGPSITTNPISQTVTSGANVTFIAAATGNPTPTVQWQVSVGGGAFTNILGATSTTLSFTASDSQTGYQYRAVFTNTVSTATTSAATLTVNSGPSITTNPSSETVTAGATATFTAAATGTPTPTVQWQVSTNGGGAFTNIAGATSATLSFTTTAAQNSNRYQAVFANTVSSATTSAATLTVNYGPSITTNPSNQAVPTGSTATFTAAATGTPTPTVQWQVSNGGGTFTNIAGATSTTLSFVTTAGQNGYQYRAVFTNTLSTATTTSATLTLMDFTISGSPKSQTISSGHSAVYKVSLAAVNGLTGNVALTCGGAPRNATCTISPNTVMLDGTTSTTVNLNASMAVNHGTFILTFTGTLGNITHSTQVSLTVK